MPRHYARFVGHFEVRSPNIAELRVRFNNYKLDFA